MGFGAVEVSTTKILEKVHNGLPFQTQRFLPVLFISQKPKKGVYYKPYKPYFTIPFRTQEGLLND